jgi:hypothetical protein
MNHLQHKRAASLESINEAAILESTLHLMSSFNNEGEAEGHNPGNRPS